MYVKGSSISDMSCLRCLAYKWMHKFETGKIPNHIWKPGNFQSAFDTEMTEISVLKIKKLKYVIRLVVFCCDDRRNQSLDSV